MRLSIFRQPATLLAIIYTSSHPTHGSSVNSSTDGTITLPSEISSLIPACARNCFADVIEFDFPFTQCRFQPDLDCICSKAVTTGQTRDPDGVMTAGAAARDCIGTCAANDTSPVCAPANICKGNDTTEEVRNVAFNMCQGRPEPALLAQSNTTLTLTSIMSTTSGTMGTTRTVPSTAVSDSAITESPKGSASTSSSSVLATADTSTGFKVGVPLGGSAVVFLVVAACVLFRRHRWKRNRTIQHVTKTQTAMWTQEFKSELDSTAQISELESRKPIFGRSSIHELEGNRWINGM